MPEPKVGFVGADPFAAAVDGMGDHVDTHLHVRVDVPGRLEAERLRSALVILARSLPELGARFERRWWRSRWVLDPAPAWLIEEHEAPTPEDAEAREAALYAEPFEQVGGLPVRLVLLHLPGHDRLLLRVSHLLADGGGTKNLCYRIAECYRMAGEDPAWVCPDVPHPHPLPRLLACLRPRLLPAMIRGALEELFDNRPIRPMLVPMGPSGPGAARFRVLHLPAARVTRLAARWKARGVTLNDLAIAAFTRAVVLCFPEANAQRSHAALVATADLRQYGPPLRDVCNYSALRPLVIGRLPLPAAEDNLARVVATTSAWKRGRTGVLLGTPVMAVMSILPHAWIRAVLHRFLARLVTPAGACTGLTNIGPIDAEALDFGDGPCTAAMIISPLAPAPTLITALTGCAGALDFTLAFRDPQLAPADAERLITAMDRELAALEGAGILTVTDRGEPR
jgi:NRPS condensation-like uncharacterized protein